MVTVETPFPLSWIVCDVYTHIKKIYGVKQPIYILWDQSYLNNNYMIYPILIQSCNGKTYKYIESLHTHLGLML